MQPVFFLTALHHKVFLLYCQIFKEVTLLQENAKTLLQRAPMPNQSTTASPEWENTELRSQRPHVGVLSAKINEFTLNDHAEADDESAPGRAGDIMEICERRPQPDRGASLVPTELLHYLICSLIVRTHPYYV